LIREVLKYRVFLADDVSVARTSDWETPRGRSVLLCPPRFLAMSNCLGRETGPVVLEDAMWARTRDMNQRRRWLGADCIHIDVSC
jgi:hypothetical protein